MQYGNSGMDAEVDLTQFDDDYGQIEVESGEFTPLPDGKYQVNVDRVELTKSQNGNPMIKWTLRVLAPVHRGRLMWKNSVITQKSLKWAKKDLVIAGLNLDKLSLLGARLDELVNIQLEVTKRTKGDDENIYFNQRITLEDGDLGENDMDEAMIPF